MSRSCCNITMISLYSWGAVKLWGVQVER